MVVVKVIELDHVAGALTSKNATVFALFCDLILKKIKIADFLKK